MDLARELLDQQVRDRDAEKMGKVDGVVLELRSGAPPQVAAIEIGPVTLGHRLHPVVGRWVRALEIGCGVGGESPLRLRMSKVTEVGMDVRVDVKAKETIAWAWERRSRLTYLLSVIPVDFLKRFIAYFGCRSAARAISAESMSCRKLAAMKSHMRARLLRGEYGEDCPPSAMLSRRGVSA